jgi:hypothetical protein
MRAGASPACDEMRSNEMSNDSNLPVAGDGFEIIGDDNAERVIQGSIIRCIDGVTRQRRSGLRINQYPLNFMTPHTIQVGLLLPTAINSNPLLRSVYWSRDSAGP